MQRGDDDACDLLVAQPAIAVGLVQFLIDALGDLTAEGAFVTALLGDGVGGFGLDLGDAFRRDGIGEADAQPVGGDRAGGCWRRTGSTVVAGGLG